MDYSMKVASMVLLALTCALGTAGNAFVVWIAGVKMKTTITTVWYVNLAVADLLWCLTIPLSMAYVVLEPHWPYGATMCKILPTVGFLNMFASVFTLTLISLDRFTGIHWPIWAKHHRSVVWARLLCGLAWLLALLLCLPELLYREYRESDDGGGEFCVYNDTAAVTFSHVTRPVFGFLVPLMVIAVCSLLSFRKVSVSRARSQKILRVMVGVVTAFFLCWMPAHALRVVMNYGGARVAEVARATYPLAMFLAYFNSCLNPALYVYMGRDFRNMARLSLRQTVENTFRENGRGSALRHSFTRAHRARVYSLTPAQEPVSPVVTTKRRLSLVIV